MEKILNPELANLIGITEFSKIEQEILRMMSADTSKDCATGTCS